MKIPRLMTSMILAVGVLSTCIGLATGKDRNPVPETADVMVTISSIERLHEAFGIGALREEFPERFEELANDMKADVGIDLLDLESLRQSGVRTDKAVYVAWFSELSEAGAVFAVYLPGDEETLERVVSSGDSTVTGRIEHEGTAIRFSDNERTAVFLRDSHVVIVSDSKDEGDGAAVPAAEELVRPKLRAMEDNKHYRNVVKKLPEKADIHVYVGSKPYSKLALSGAPLPGISDKESDEHIEAVNKALGLENAVAAYSMTIHPDRLAIEGLGIYDKNSATLAWYRVDGDPLPFIHRLAASPWLASLARLNGPAMWKSLEPLYESVRADTAKSADEMLAEFRDETGIDLKDEIWLQVNGNIGLVVERVGMMGSDLVAFMQVRDATKASATVEKLTEYLRKNLDDTTAPGGGAQEIVISERTAGRTPFYYVQVPFVGEVCYGVSEDHFVVTTSLLRFQAIVDGRTGLLDTIDDEVVQASLRDPTGTVFYLDFAGLANDLRQFGPLLGEESGPLIDLLADLGECVAASTIDGREMKYEMRLTTRRKEIWKELAAFLLGLHKEESPRVD